jgi:hypothetical protein
MDEKKAPCMRAPYRGHDLGTHICCFVLLITLTFFLLPFFIVFFDIPFTKKYIILVFGGYGICCLLH